MIEEANTTAALRSLYDDWLACLEFAETLVVEQSQGWRTTRVKDQLHIQGPKLELVILAQEFDQVRFRNISAETCAQFYNEAADVPPSTVVRDFRISAVVREDIKYFLFNALNEAVTESAVWQTALIARDMPRENKH